MSHFDHKFTLFWNAVVYVDRLNLASSSGETLPVATTIINALTPVEMKLRLHGASIQSSLTKDVTHVVVSGKDRSRMPMMEKVRLQVFIYMHGFAQKPQSLPCDNLC
jgi:hypothetical protein